MANRCKNTLTADIPQGWARVRFEDVTRLVPTTGRKVNQRDYEEGGTLPIVDQGQELVGGYTHDTGKRVQCELPVVVFGDHTRVFKYIDFGFAAGADGIKVIKPTEVCEPRLLYHFLQAVELPDRGYSRHFRYLRTTCLPLPPLAEQRRIVAKIEALFRQSRRGREALEAIPDLLARFRQSVLSAAFRGELVEQDPNDEPASLLLERILAERRRRREEDLQSRREDPSRSKYKEPAKPETSSLPELPAGWVWGTLEEISSDIVDCLHSTPKFEPEGQYCIDTTCMTQGRILFERARFVTPDTYQGRVRRLEPKRGDVLFSREGTIGLTAVVPAGVDLCLGQRMMMFRPARGIVSDWFMWGLLSPQFRRQWQPKVTGTTSPHVNIGDLRQMALPVAPSLEQRRIVSRIEALFALADTLEANVASARRRLLQVDQAILVRAFRGELVEQDPNDEPASALLERIQRGLKDTTG